MDIPIELYAPYGTAPKELTIDFLSQEPATTLQRKTVQSAINPAWLGLIEILHQIESKPYHWPTGRTIFQKIAYVATREGLPTGFHYERGSFGPFSKDLKNAETKRMHHSQNTYTPETHDADGPLRLTDYGFIICGRGFLPAGPKGAVLIAGYTTAGVLIATEFLVRMTWSEIRTLKRRFKGDKRFALLIQGVLETSDGRFTVSAPPELLSLIPESDFREPYTYDF